MLLGWYESEDCLLDPSDAPFRDEPDGDDAIESIGTGTPWYEDVADWFVAAYLAVTFTPAAGLFYITTLRNIRLQFRARNYGAIAEIFLDDVLQVEVDTYSPVDEIIDIFIRGTPPEEFAQFDVETHEIRIVHTGEHNAEATAATDGYAIEVVRDYIGLEAGTRFYNPETDGIEVLLDGVWTPIEPAADPRRITTLPPRETADPRCDAAENLTAGVKTWVDAEINALTLGSSAASLASVFFLTFPLLGIAGKIIGIVEGLVGALFTAGASAMTSAFTEAVYDDLKCHFYDAMDIDGRMTQESLQGVEDALFADPGGTVYNVLRVLFLTSGEGGLNDLAATGSLEGDCSDCNDCPGGTDWCVTLFADTAENPGGLTPASSVWGTLGLRIQEPSPSFRWVWFSPQNLNRGTTERATLITLTRTLQAGTYTRLELEGTLDFGNFTTDIREFTVKIGATTLISEIADFSGALLWEGEIILASPADLVINGVFSYMNPGTADGGCVLYNLNIGGSGTQPSGF